MKSWLHIILIYAAAAFMSAESARAADTKQLVLVSNVNSDFQSVSLSDIRKAYLGVPVSYHGKLLVPLINLSDESLYEVFLQKVMYMSAQAYQREVTRRFIHAQGLRPKIYRNKHKLLAELSSNPQTFTYIMWQDEVKSHTNLKIVAVLWDGNS